jgi:very-short-patch-repair endonuclease
VTTPVADQERVDAQLSAWRNDLIDLSRTNRLLNFRHTKSATLELIEPGPRDILTGLNGRQHGWFFSPQETEDDGDNDIGTIDDRPTARERPANHVLTTKPTPALLDTALRALERRSSQEYLDKGIWILYLGIGMLHWADTDGQQFESPLLLVPVQVSRASISSPFRMVATDDDIVVNPGLALKLQRDFAITLPEFENGVEEDPASLLDRARVLVASRDGWVVNDRTILATFAFVKQAMYQDLLDNAAQIAEHPLVRALALGPESDFALPGDAAPLVESELDALAPPEQMVSILDADATQRRCITAAVRGASFVMDGPPGTGKSQTIANMIAELLVSGKSVLFVSEKAAALEVVQKRLAEAGIDDYVLELHSQKATRKEVALQLANSLTSHPRPGRTLAPADLHRLEARRHELSDYAAALNEVREPLGRTLHQVVGRLVSLHDLPPPPSVSLDQSLSAEALEHLLSLAGELARAWGPVTRGQSFLWRDLSDPDSLALQTSQVARDVAQTDAALATLTSAAATIGERLRLSPPTRFIDVERLRDLVDLVTARPTGVIAAWLTASTLAAVDERVEALATICERVDRQRQVAQDLLGPGWAALPLSHRDALKAARKELRGSPVATVDIPLTATVDDLRATASAVTRLGDAVPTISDDAGAIIRQFGLRDENISLGRAMELADLALLAGAPTRPEEGWFNPALQKTLDEACRVLATLVEHYREQQAAVAEVFTDAVLEIDTQALQQRFATVHRGFRRFSGACRADKRLLATCARTSTFSRKAVDLLPAATQWRDVTVALRGAEATHAGVLGEFYAGPATDFAAVENALAIVRQAVSLAGARSDTAILAARLGRHASADAAAYSAGQRIRGWLDAWMPAFPASLAPALGSVLSASLADLISWSTETVAADGPLATCVTAISAVDDLAGSAGSLDRTQRALDSVADLAARQSELAAGLDVDGVLLGPLYEGLTTAWPRLRQAVGWARSGRERFGNPLPEAAAAALVSASFTSNSLSSPIDAWNDQRMALLARFQPAQSETIAEHLGGGLNDARTVLKTLFDTTGDISEWVVHVRARRALAEFGMDTVVQQAVDLRLPAQSTAAYLERSLLEAWVSAILAGDSRLGTLRATDRDALVAEFRQLDVAHIKAAPSRVMQACNERRPTTTLGPTGIIQNEAAKKRKHMPVRRLLEKTETVTRFLKPCFMMSPLTVSQFLPSAYVFDVVIFDEASQVRPADAVNCVYRGSQLVIAGDQKQLPPTSFFSTSTETGSDDYEEGQLDVFESVLDIAKASGKIRSLPLLWHYRSRHEDLITFSNISFYDGALVTFPSARQKGDDVGIELFHVQGVYRRGSTRDNPREADAVVERVLHHARRHPQLSLGVVAFSEAQATCIERALENARLRNRDLDSYFTDDRLDGFFIKNLENVQGDERDTIIFSIGYGRDELGKLTMNFGPVNVAGGHRRLNVAVTRARRRVEVVTTISAADIPDTVETEGVRHLRRYLDYADRGRPALAMELRDSVRDVESPFEDEVLRVIRSWGYDATPQVGTAGYRIDMGVRHPDKPGLYVLGVECDGATYHSAAVARDRDRLRQQVLTNLGWDLHRIWGPSWYNDRANQERRLRDAIEDAVRRGDDGNEPPPLTDSLPPDPRRLPQRDQVVLDAWPEWTARYTVAQVGPIRTNCEMHDPDARPLIQQLVLRIVRDEGPLHHGVLLRRVREAWRVGRAGSRIRENFDAALSSAAAGGQISVDAEGFVSVPGQAITWVRVPVSDEAETYRSVSEVPPAELRLAVLGLATDAHAIEDDELTTETAMLFGWQRRGADIAAALQATIADLLESRQLVRRPDHTLSANPAGAMKPYPDAVRATSPVVYTVDGQRHVIQAQAPTGAHPESGTISPGDHSPIAFCVAIIEKQRCPFLSPEKQTVWFDIVRGYDRRSGTWQDFYQYLDQRAKAALDDWAPRLCHRLRVFSDHFRLHGQLAAVEID